MNIEGSARLDQQALEELRAVMRRREQPPPPVVAAAIDAFRWQSVAQAIVGLEFDSLVDDDDQLARVRDEAGERRLCFAGAGHRIEIAMVGRNSALAGRVDPPLEGPMLLRHPDGSSLSAPVDENGRFFFEGVGHGPVSLRPARAHGLIGDFETEWVTI